MNSNPKALKFATALLGASLAFAVPASASGTGYAADIGGEKTTNFTKYVTMKKDVILPDIDFSFSISAGSTKSYSIEGKTFEILAGIEPDNVTMSAVDAEEPFHMGFGHEDPVLEDANSMIKDYSPDTDKYMEKEGTLDFSGVHFTEPGVYRYILQESGDTQSVYNDDQTSRILDVYVINDDTDPSEKKLKIGGYVLHANADDLPTGDGYGTTDANPAGKSQGFTNEYKTVDLTFRKEVTGSQASKDKYFKFTVEFTGGIPNDEVAVDLTKADATVMENAATQNPYEGMPNPNSLTFGKDGTVTGTFYLQHGQEIMIEGLPMSVNYEITEAAEDYKSTPMGVDGYSDPNRGTTDAEGKPAIKTSFLNTRDGFIPTGIAVAVAPFAGLTLIAGIGILCVTKKRKL